jgi:predicted metal-dependent hydrolase
VRHARARRYVVRVRSDGVVRVTIPRGGSRREAEAFLARSAEWVTQQREKLQRHGPAAQGPLRDGDAVLLRGVPTRLRVERFDRRARVDLGGAHAVIPSDTIDLRPAATAILRSLALRELPPRLRALAQQHGLAVSRVTVRDQRSRWGSCARSGNISLNWRLVQMPPEVCDYVLLHELMHLREANHSTRFWKHVNAVCPWHLSARRWLAREGRSLL